MGYAGSLTTLVGNFNPGPERKRDGGGDTVPPPNP